MTLQSHSQSVSLLLPLTRKHPGTTLKFAKIHTPVDVKRLYLVKQVKSLLSAELPIVVLMFLAIASLVYSAIIFCELTVRLIMVVFFL